MSNRIEAGVHATDELQRILGVPEKTLLPRDQSLQQKVYDLVRSELYRQHKHLVSLQGHGFFWTRFGTETVHLQNYRTEQLATAVPQILKAQDRMRYVQLTHESYLALPGVGDAEYQIFIAIADHGISPVSIQTLTEQIGISQSTVYAYLSLLRKKFQRDPEISLDVERVYKHDVQLKPIY